MLSSHLGRFLCFIVPIGTIFIVPFGMIFHYRSNRNDVIVPFGTIFMFYRSNRNDFYRPIWDDFSLSFQSERCYRPIWDDFYVLSFQSERFLSSHLGRFFIIVPIGTMLSSHLG